MIKVCKFGGSSVANAAQFKKVKDIVLSDDSRKYIVISAVGKSSPDDVKMTDLLYLCNDHLKYGLSCEETYLKIEKRLLQIRDDLGLSNNIEGRLQKFRNELVPGLSLDYLVSRGEYLTAILMAEYLGYPFVDAKDLICFNDDGSINYERINRKFRKISEKYDHFVVPGFYGAYDNDEIMVMSRGGSDVTGSIIANITNCNLYENWTDVSGILMADPRIVDNPKPIKYISYEELRELSYMGASVLHEEAVFPVKEKNIPINIKNTNAPDDIGTMIKAYIPENETTSTITGIAGKKDFSILTLKASQMSHKAKTIYKVLEMFDSYNVTVEQVPTGIDSFSVVVNTKQLKPKLKSIIRRLKTSLDIDEITLIDNVSLIATVSRNMKNKFGSSGRLFKALGDEGINVRMISQTSEEINIIIGVDNADFERTIQTIYNKFENK